MYVDALVVLPKVQKKLNYFCNEIDRNEKYIVRQGICRIIQGAWR